MKDMFEEKGVLLGRTCFNPPITGMPFTIETTIKFNKKGKPITAKSKQIKNESN